MHNQIYVLRSWLVGRDLKPPHLHHPGDSKISYDSKILAPTYRKLVHAMLLLANSSELYNHLQQNTVTG